MPLINCSDCGKIVSSRAERCPKCACPVKISVQENENYNETILYSDKTFFQFQLFAVLLGPFGIHNFYIGRNIIGAIQLGFTLLLLFGSIFINELSFFWMLVYLFAWAESASVTKDSEGLLLQKKGF